jgi:nicotinamide riboside transporter PnuC
VEFLVRRVKMTIGELIAAILRNEERSKTVLAGVAGLAGVVAVFFAVVAQVLL